jgi:hypothetical protein
MMAGSRVIPSDDAAATLARVRATRHRTRGDLQTYWFACVVYGMLLLLSAPFFPVLGGAAVGLFWAVVTPPAAFAVVRHARAHALSVGVAHGARPYRITGACLVAACFALGFGGGIAGVADVANYGPPVSIAVAYVVFAWLERSAALGVVALSLGFATAAVAFADVANGGQLLALLYGASLVVLGLCART